MTTKSDKLIGVVLLVFFCALRLAGPAPTAAASEHLWPLAYLHYEQPAPETVSFTMTEEQFQGQVQALEQRLDTAYARFAATLPPAQQPLLEAAQAAWLDCYAAYALALEQQLDTRVKVFYGEPGERKTNIYRDTVLTLLSQRAEDLESWAAGRYVRTAATDLDELEALLAEGERLLDAAMGRNIYVMEERYRVPTQRAQSAWYVYLQQQDALWQDQFAADAAQPLAERLLQVERMLDLTLLQVEGSVFFHREREE